ncbi:hypothetical protein J3R83DRAFT_11097 [Lanmaoa asiatica]|nr:hypothetical protein J3R83DRAFT_11097 [Lanmaoa asiatica]
MRVSEARRKNQQDDGDDEEDEDEEGEEEEEEEDDDDDDDDPGPNATAQPGLTRAERRELKKKQAAEKQAQKKIDEDDEDADLINPNHIEKKLNISDLGSTELTRKEREAKEKQEAKSRYWKLHAAGQTDEAKSDLARLKRIREEREAAQAKRKAEAEAKAAEIEAKKKAATSGKRV